VIIDNAATANEAVVGETDAKGIVNAGLPSSDRSGQVVPCVNQVAVCGPGNKFCGFGLAGIGIKDFFRIFVTETEDPQAVRIKLIGHREFHLAIPVDMTSNIVHRYFKKELEGSLILVRVNPVHLKGTELIVHPGGQVDQRDLEFDETIYDDLTADDFKEASAMEFQLYFSGLAGV
jgi:hypothetical protein